MSPVSRREFVTAAAAAAIFDPRRDLLSAPITAQAVVDRVKQRVGVAWSSDEVDTFKAGDPSTVVTGIVTTSMATLEVLQKAVQAGANLVITGARTFSSRPDLGAPAGRGGGPAAGGRGALPRGGGAGAT